MKAAKDGSIILALGSGVGGEEAKQTPVGTDGWAPGAWYLVPGEWGGVERWRGRASPEEHDQPWGKCQSRRRVCAGDRLVQEEGLSERDGGCGEESNGEGSDWALRIELSCSQHMQPRRRTTAFRGKALTSRIASREFGHE